MLNSEKLRGGVSTVHRLAVALALLSAVTSLPEEMVPDELVYGVIARAAAGSPLLLDPMPAVERCATPKVCTRSCSLLCCRARDVRVSVVAEQRSFDRVNQVCAGSECLLK